MKMVKNITVLALITTCAFAGIGFHMATNYSDMDVEIFQQKNIKARTIVYDHTYVNKGLNFAANDGETPDVPQVAVLNFMKTPISNGYAYEKAENSLNSGDIGTRSGWGLLKRLDQMGEDVLYIQSPYEFFHSPLCLEFFDYAYTTKLFLFALYFQ